MSPIELLNNIFERNDMFNLNHIKKFKDKQFFQEQINIIEKDLFDDNSNVFKYFYNMTELIKNKKISVENLSVYFNMFSKNIFIKISEDNYEYFFKGLNNLDCFFDENTKVQDINLTLNSLMLYRKILSANTLYNSSIFPSSLKEKSKITEKKIYEQIFKIINLNIFKTTNDIPFLDLFLNKYDFEIDSFNQHCYFELPIIDANSLFTFNESLDADKITFVFKENNNNSLTSSFFQYICLNLRNLLDYFSDNHIKKFNYSLEDNKLIIFNYSSNYNNKVFENMILFLTDYYIKKPNSLLGDILSISSYPSIEVLYSTFREFELKSIVNKKISIHKKTKI